MHCTITHEITSIPKHPLKWDVGVMVCAQMSPQSRTHVATGGPFSQVVEYRVCDVGIKAVWLLNQCTDWFATALILAVWSEARLQIKCKRQKEDA